ncbi:conserved hypothetical protein [Paracoccus denitrificans PD1222]|uniref:HNH nuclease domain-containing protein n=1 Tax=Paracoccus denitrificans (strain Pd 1222) TaxID=318586 RepID=A1AYN2_PARDP|nr:conserved hypothetical protein [Paracoccus denitrificans PD1222]
MTAIGICLVCGCDRPIHARCLCNAHYKRFRRHGDPLGGNTSVGDPIKFLKFAILYCGNNCLLWPFSKNPFGYGQIAIERFPKLVHRIVCEEVHGPPVRPDDHAAHSCGNGHLGCVNPIHIRWATAKENEADKIIHGSRSRGERHGAHKLSEAHVRQIRRWRGTMSCRDIGKLLGVSPSTVNRIHNGGRWGWLE